MTDSGDNSYQSRSPGINPDTPLCSLEALNNGKWKRKRRDIVSHINRVKKVATTKPFMYILWHDNVKIFDHHGQLQSECWGRKMGFSEANGMAILQDKKIIIASLREGLLIICEQDKPVNLLTGTFHDVDIGGTTVYALAEEKSDGGKRLFIYAITGELQKSSFHVKKFDTGLVSKKNIYTCVFNEETRPLIIGSVKKGTIYRFAVEEDGTIWNRNIRRYGRLGYSEPGELYEPRVSCSYGHYVLVADGGNKRLQLLDLQKDDKEWSIVNICGNTKTIYAATLHPGGKLLFVFGGTTGSNMYWCLLDEAEAHSHTKCTLM